MMSQPIVVNSAASFFTPLISKRAGLEASGAEDGDAIVLAGRAAKAREVIDDLPQTGDGAFEDRDGGVFVAEA